VVGPAQRAPGRRAHLPAGSSGWLLIRHSAGSNTPARLS
jgi:hypothetical protein